MVSTLLLGSSMSARGELTSDTSVHADRAMAHCDNTHNLFSVNSPGKVPGMLGNVAFSPNIHLGALIANLVYQVLLPTEQT